MPDIIQNVKEVPESIYLLARMGKQEVLFECIHCKNKLTATIDVPTGAGFCKAFTVDEAANKMTEKCPGVTFRNLGSMTVTDFVEGCKIEVVEKKKPEEKKKTKKQYYDEFLKDIGEAGRFILKEDEQKVLENVISKLKGV